MKRKGRIVAGALVAAILAGAWLVARRAPLFTPAETISSSGASAERASPAAPASPSGPSASLTEARRAAAPARAALEIPAATRERIAQCLARSAAPAAAQTAGSLDALVPALSAGGPSTSELAAENIHIRGSDGRVLRLRVVPDEAADRRVRFFSVDAENLPVPEPLPEALRPLSPSEASTAFRAMGEVIYESRTSKRVFANGSWANVTEENGHISELQLFFEGGSLGCAWHELDSPNPNLDCRCL